jgi:hypothetical protein
MDLHKQKILATLKFKDTNIQNVIRKKNDWLQEFGFIENRHNNIGITYSYKVEYSSVESSIELNIFENASETSITLN